MTTLKNVDDTSEGAGPVEPSKRRLPAILGIVVGITAVIGITQWRSETVPIEMALYTAFVFVPLFLHFWSNVNRGRFWVGILAALTIHLFVLFLIRESFPFRTVLIVIPGALIECSIMFSLLVRLLGDNKAN